MSVPITSDLAGYVTFWLRVVIALFVVLAVLSAAHFWLLLRILTAILALKGGK